MEALHQVGAGEGGVVVRAERGRSDGDRAMLPMHEVAADRMPPGGVAGGRAHVGVELVEDVVLTVVMDGPVRTAAPPPEGRGEVVERAMRVDRLVEVHFPEIYGFRGCERPGLTRAGSARHCSRHEQPSISGIAISARLRVLPGRGTVRGGALGDSRRRRAGGRPGRYSGRSGALDESCTRKVGEACGTARGVGGVKAHLAVAPLLLAASLLRCGSSESAASHYERGQLHLRAGRYLLAAGEYRRAVELEPGFANAHAKLGLCHALRLEPGKALEPIRRAISLEPDNGLFYMHLGKAYMLLTDGDRAEKGVQTGGRARSAQGQAVLRPRGDQRTPQPPRRG